MEYPSIAACCRELIGQKKTDDQIQKMLMRHFTLDAERALRHVRWYRREVAAVNSQITVTVANGGLEIVDAAKRRHLISIPGRAGRLERVGPLIESALNLAS